MSEDLQLRLIGHLKDGGGRSVAVGVVRDVVVIRQHGVDIRLGPAERDLFSRRYFEAVAGAEAWAKERAGEVS